MADVVLYGTLYCPYCIRAKALLERKQVPFEEIRVDLDPRKRMEMMEKGGGHTVPQIFIDGMSIGGCDELHSLEYTGELDPMLSASA
ncbi:MAG: glutaredoxin 3 [Motiliproteus sp.]|nr:glutaredoxin 3 [Motiliproteus sp.]